MDWLKNIFIKYHMTWLTGLLSLVSFNFITNVYMALQNDGVIDPVEYHHMAASANSVEMMILLALMAVFKKK